MKTSFFRSKHVKWKQGIHIQKALWHSCMQYGWPAIRAGKAPNKYAEYIVLSICIGRYGVCWQFYPKSKV